MVRVFFLDCGKGPFLVTANHVYQDYLSIKQKFSHAICQVQNLSFQPEDRLIDRDTTIDIATFEISQIEINQVGTVDGKSLYPKVALEGDQSSWPPAPPEVEKGVWFSGYPGQERIHTGPFELNFGIFTALTIADNVNERTISCLLDREFAVETPSFPLSQQGYDMGGLSGSPLVTVVGGENDLMTWRLGGVITEANSNWEIVIASRADFILPDGKLKRIL